MTEPTTVRLCRANLPSGTVCGTYTGVSRSVAQRRWRNLVESHGYRPDVVGARVWHSFESTRTHEEIQIEREQIAAVFRVCISELFDPGDGTADEPWPRCFWYEGVPEWAEMELLGCRGSLCDGTHEYRTIVSDETWGPRYTPIGWERVEAYFSSGETECRCKYERETGEDTGKPDPDCPLCEGNGYIYIGDGMAEVVYRRLED